MDPDGRHDDHDDGAEASMLPSRARMLHDDDEMVVSSPRPPKGGNRKILSKDDLIAATRAAHSSIQLNRANSLPVVGSNYNSNSFRKSKIDDDSTGKPPMSPQQKKRMSQIRNGGGGGGPPPPPPPPPMTGRITPPEEAHPEPPTYQDYEDEVHPAEEGVEVVDPAATGAAPVPRPSPPGSTAADPPVGRRNDVDNLSQPSLPASLHVPPVFRVLAKPGHDEMSSIGFWNSESSSSGSDSDSSSSDGSRQRRDFKVRYDKKKRRKSKRGGNGDPPNGDGEGETEGGDDGNNNKPSSWKKYSEFNLAVTSSRDNYRAKEVRLVCNSNNNRPHMRSLFVGWWCLFVASSCWYGIVSILLPELAANKGNGNDDYYGYDGGSSNNGILSSLSDKDIWISIIVSMPLSTMLQAPIGIACEAYGPRKPILLVMCVLSMPMLAGIGMLQSTTGFFLLRFLSGGFGCIFTIVQYWCSQMFIPEVVQATNCLFGYGNLDSGLSQLLFGTIIFPLLKTLFDDNMNLVWRSILIVPCALASITGIIAYFYSDDTPRGNLDEIRRKQQNSDHHGKQSEDVIQESKANFNACLANVNVWILTLQYSCLFGVFLVLVNILPLYYSTQYGQSVGSSAALASIYGFTGLLGRFFGNSWSTACDKNFGLKGRIFLYTGLLVGEGVMCAMFGPYTSSLSGTIAFMVLIALFQHSALVSIMSIVPYVDPIRTNHVTAIVTSGGGIGGAIFGAIFLFVDYSSGFLAMGVVVLASSILAAFLHVPLKNQDNQGASSNKRKRMSYDENAMLGGSHRGGGTNTMDLEQGLSSGAESSYSETHLSLSTDNEHSINAKQIDFTGTIYTPTNRRHRKKSLKNKKKKGEQTSSISCSKNHTRYELKTTYGAFDDPTVMRSVLGRTPPNFHCRECKAKMSMKVKNKRNIKSQSRRYGIVPSPTRPVFCCVECHSTFVCHLCWRNRKQKQQQESGQNPKGENLPKWAAVASDFLF